MNKKKIVKLIVLFLMVFVFIFFIVNCGKKSRDYPESAVKDFMKTCVRDNVKNQNRCDCIIKKIQKKYSYEEYKQLDAKMGQTGKPTDELLEIVNACRK